MTSGTSGVYVGPLDYGDLPEPKYMTTRKTSGASGPAPCHLRSLFMGTTFATDLDMDGNGQPNATATGDNLVNQNDEQAVTFPTFVAGQAAAVKVCVTNSTGATATLYGFIDWNNDGDFGDTGEADDHDRADGHGRLHHGHADLQRARERPDLPQPGRAFPPQHGHHPDGYGCPGR